MKQRVEEMEKEANKLRELQAAAEKNEQDGTATDDASVPMETDEERALSDQRSVYVGNVGSILAFQFSTPLDRLLLYRIGGLRGYS